MTRSAAVICWAAGAVLTATAATVLPWSRYGGIDISLYRLPNWGWYLGAAVVLNLLVGWLVLRGPDPGPGRWPLLAGAGLMVLTVAAAIMVMSRYDDSSAIFGRFVPLVTPWIGPGGPVAVLGATLNWFALMLRWRRAASPSVTGTPARTG